MKALSCVTVSLILAAASLAAPGDSSSKADYDRAVALAKTDPAAAIAAAKKAIEEDPDFMAAHDEYQDLSRQVVFDVYRTKGMDAFVKASAQSKTALESQYAAWSKAYPNSSGVTYGLGKMYWDEELPTAKPYLLKAISINPKMSTAYFMLSIDAERWGDTAGARDYMAKAAATDPNNADYAFDYAYEFVNSDRKKFASLSLDIVKRFPNDKYGAMALYYLGEFSANDADKTRYWEQGLTQFPPAKFDWSEDSATELFDLYARTDPAKALALAQSLKDIKVSYGNSWEDNAALAQNTIQARKLMQDKDFAGAKALLDSSKISKYSKDGEMFDLLKAEATAGAGHVDDAYAALVTRYSKTPEDGVKDALAKYGQQLGKSPDQVDKDVWAARDAAAKPAPAFNLEAYLTSGKRSLADYHGKVVLLTFFFPGCGPCRGEFPHFENVLRGFRGQPVNYVAINVEADQDVYVKPFVHGTRYTFTPLKEDGKQQEQDYHVRGEPTNFLIDQTGRIVYSNFRADDPEGERGLQLMIQSLLDHQTTGASTK